jgi:outer membrane receptor protein involved in Fe transport
MFDMAKLDPVSLIALSACIAAAPPAAAEDQSAPPSQIADALSEILVTATRRTERLQDIPYNISAISAADLAKSGADSMNNLALVVPGLQNVDTGPNPRGGNSDFSMRGLRTDAPGGGGNNAFLRNGNVASVSTYYGETPIFFPLMITDLDRIEVLKGPQGTLYGSGSLAGTIRLVPKRPTFDKVEGEFNAEGGITEHSSQENYSLNGVINLPLSDTLAVRVGGAIERLGGFIDAVDLVAHTEPGNALSAPVLRVPGDPMSGYELAPIKPNSNDSTQWSLRGTVRWRPSEAIDTELSYMHQHSYTGNNQLSNPTYAGGTYLYSAPDSVSAVTGQVVPDPTVNSVNNYRAGGTYRNTADILAPTTNVLDLANLLITADVGFATFTSSTSGYHLTTEETSAYTAGTQLFNADGSLYFNYIPTIYANYPRFLFVNQTPARENNVTQELRLVSNGQGPLSYVVGAYFQHQDYDFGNNDYVPGYSSYLAGLGLIQNNPQYGDLTIALPYGHNGFEFRDRALFGELSYKITPKWQITGGVRFFWQDFRTLGLEYAYNGGASFSNTGTDPSGLNLTIDQLSKVHKHIVKFNTSYDVSDDLKVYATYSEGFRRGGANGINTSGVSASLPEYLTFAPDVAKNYELGVKGTAFSGSLRYDADVFVVDVDNFQFNGQTISGATAVFNGNKARSKGFEIDGELRATHDLVLRMAYSYTDARVKTGSTYYDYALGTLVYDPPPPTIVPLFTLLPGARLPGVSANALNLGVDYTIPRSALTLHADGVYKSSQEGNIDVTSPYYWKIPSSVVANARATYQFSAALSADLFVNNLTDATAYSGGVYTQSAPTLFSGRYVERPRTFGVGVHYRF